MEPQSVTRKTLQLNSVKQLHYSLYQRVHQKESPLILCLHPGWSGPTPPRFYGEQFLRSVWLPAFAETGALIAAPDCPTGAWNNPETKAALLELIGHLTDEHKVNPRQVSLVGYSAGGWGAWYLLAEQAYPLASAVLFATLPVLDPVGNFEENFARSDALLASRLAEWVDRLPSIPITMIHSRDDELFPYAKADLVFQTLQQAGRPVRFITIEGVGHFEGGGYVEALQNSVDWLKESWSLQ